MALDQERYDAAIDVPRNAWDPTEGQHPRHGERTLASIVGVEVHWTGSPGDIADHHDTTTELLSFERYHEVTKGWADLFYNVALDTQGNTYEGRDITIASQSNLAAWLTLLVVVGPDDTPTTPDWAAIEAGIRRVWRAVDPGQDPRTLRYHRERSSTSCPGDDLAAMIETIRTTPQEIPAMPLHADAQAAKDAGIWSGDNPDQPATREQAAIMAHRAKEQAIRAFSNGSNAREVAELAAAVNSTEDALQALIRRLTALEDRAPQPSAASLPDVVKVQIVGLG